MLHNILVPLDGSAAAEAAVAPAAALARTHVAQVHLVLVTELSRTDPTFDEMLETEHQTYRDRRMQLLSERLHAQLGLSVHATRLVGAGAVAVALADYADDVRADLIVMTTHGRTGMRRAWLGSVADDLMHMVRTPLLLLRRDENPTAAARSLDRILVTLDGSESAETALAVARTLCFHRPATLILARVVSPVPLDVVQAPGIVVTDAAATQELVDNAHRYLEALASELRAESVIEVETAVELEAAGFPALPTAATIAGLAARERADLVALTTHERGLSRMLLGSVADRVLRDTDCALLVCHGVPQRTLEATAEPELAGASAS